MSEDSYHKELERSLDARLNQYRYCKSKTLAHDRQSLEAEHARIQSLLDGIHTGLISDEPIQIQYLHARKRILDTLLNQTIPVSDEVHTLLRAQLAQAYRACQYLYDEHGLLKDIHGFAHRVLGTLTTTDGKRVSKIRTHVAFVDGQPVRAFFNSHNAHLASRTVRTYTLTQTKKGAVFVGTPPLSTSQRSVLLTSLAEHLRTYS